MDDSQQALERLAAVLARNHVYLSAGPDQYRSACTSLLKDPGDPRVPPPRVVVVVGAGASNAACNLPTGGEAAERLRNRIKGVDRALVDDEIHRITVEYRLEEHDFETVLLALSKFDQASVLRELGQIFRRRYYPWLGYELIAHWLKHRFVDAVVNFNFDELLDQAVDDELGGTRYHKVVSDGDCPESPDDWIDPRRDRFRFPLYLKPHGTASHKSSMRFTRSSYTLLPRELHGLLTRLFDSRSLCVIVVGHAMQSVEFNDILRHSLHGLSFVFIDRAKPEVRWPGAPSPALAEDWVDTEPPHTLTTRLHDLAGLVSAQFRDGTGPRGIDRHVLISELFSTRVDLDRPPKDDATREKTYLRNRIYLEISLAVAKAKGFLSTEHLAAGRVGRYYRLYRKVTDSHRSILGFCDDLELRKFGYARDTVYLAARTRADEAGRLRRPTLERKEFEAVVESLAQQTCDRLSTDLQARISTDELVKALWAMYRGDEVEVSVDMDGISTEVFSEPHLLPTLTSLHLETRRLFSLDAWDALVCTAESGLWLADDPWVKQRIVERGARLALVVADEANRPDLEAAYGELLGDRVRWLPWWLHNRHVTVFLKERTPTAAIYFERRLRTSEIVPVMLSDADAGLVMDTFVAYWTKAVQPEAEIDGARLKKERTLLLRALYEAEDAAG